MPQYISLLPSNGQKRTGKLYDNPDGDDQRVVKSGKILVTDDGRELVQGKTWTEEGGWLVEVHTLNHALVARATSKHEEKAWEKVVEELRLQGYRL